MDKVTVYSTPTQTLPKYMQYFIDLYLLNPEEARKRIVIGGRRYGKSYSRLLYLEYLAANMAPKEKDVIDVIIDDYLNERRY